MHMSGLTKTNVKYYQPNLGTQNYGQGLKDSVKLLIYNILHFAFRQAKNAIEFFRLS